MRSCCKKCLKTKEENRAIHNIPTSELDNHLFDFFMRIKQKSGIDFDPVTLRSMLGSFERSLNTRKYGISVVHGHEFTLTKQCLKTKYKVLKQASKGSRPKTADEITATEIDYLCNKEQLGNRDPDSLLNKLWLNNSLAVAVWHKRWRDRT